MTPIQVETERLTLTALPIELLQALVHGWTELESALHIHAADIHVPEEFREAMPQSFALSLDQCRAHPDEYVWYTVWPVVLTAENRVIGTIGFAGPPDDRGYVFTGYWIDERYPIGAS